MAKSVRVIARLADLAIDEVDDKLRFDGRTELNRHGVRQLAHILNQWLKPPLATKRWDFTYERHRSATDISYVGAAGENWRDADGFRAEDDMRQAITRLLANPEVRNVKVYVQERSGGRWPRRSKVYSGEEWLRLTAPEETPCPVR